ncbi:MAG: M56 family metallopeptidase [Acidobacteriia bacterium]|nr:M56 family metallopeptidase [Terriglobia bacterium]
MHTVLNAVAQVSAERMVDSLAIGLALAAFAGTLLRMAPRQNSATRFSVWFAALIGTAVLPLLGIGGNGATTDTSLHALISVPGSWALYLFGAWTGIAILALARVGTGFIELRRLRRSCRPIEFADASWHSTVARFCPSRKVEILTSDRIQVPTAIGFAKPAVVIPSRLLEELSTAELNQVLLHELAHLRRWDDWSNVVQQFVKALLFFHPAVWWMEERISLEREMACDEAVLAETRSPRAYAECLANLAEKSMLRRSAALAQAAVNRVRQTTLRVARILDVNRPKPAPARKSILAVAAGLACAFAMIAWHAPRLVAFQDAPHMIASAAPTPLMEQRPTITPVTHVAPQPVAKAAERRQARSAGMLAKATVSDIEQNPRERKRNTLELAERQVRAAQVIQARALAAPQPAFTTGVLVIFVDDPVFGPRPIVWHFVVWQVPPPPSEPGTPQKST